MQKSRLPYREVLEPHPKTFRAHTAFVSYLSGRHMRAKRRRATLLRWGCYSRSQAGCLQARAALRPVDRSTRDGLGVHPLWRFFVKVARHARRRRQGEHLLEAMLQKSTTAAEMLLRLSSRLLSRAKCPFTHFDLDANVGDVVHPLSGVLRQASSQNAAHR